MLRKIIILTRYNLPLTFSSNQNQFNPLDTGWLEHRSSIFREICCRSIDNQSYKNFDWFIGFHENTPEIYLKNLPQNAIPIKAASLEDFLRTVKQCVSGYDALASLRLDNDDAISVDFLLNLDYYFDFFIKSDLLGEKSALNYRSGVELKLQEKELLDRDFPGSSFVTLFEKKSGDGFDTVLKYHHAHIHKSVTVTNMPTLKPMWLISIHDKNVGNTSKGVINSNVKETLHSRFNINFE